MRRFASLCRKADFERLRRRGRRVATPILTLYRSEPYASDRTSLVGITVTKAVGKAVIRNKLRRRLAAIVHDALVDRPAMRLLIVPRPAAAGADFDALRADVTSALEKP